MSTVRIFRHNKIGLFSYACDTRVIIQADDTKNDKSLFSKLEFICDDVKNLLIFTVFIQNRHNNDFMNFFIHLLNNSPWVKKSIALKSDEIKDFLPEHSLQKSHDFLGLVSHHTVRDSIHTHDSQFMVDQKLDTHAHIVFKNCNPFKTMLLVINYIDIFQNHDLSAENTIFNLFLAYQLNIIAISKNARHFQNAIDNPDNKDEIEKSRIFVENLKSNKLIQCDFNLAQQYQNFSENEYKKVNEQIKKKDYATAVQVSLSYLNSNSDLPEKTKDSVTNTLNLCQSKLRRQNRFKLFAKSAIAVIAVAGLAIKCLSGSKRSSPASS